MRVIILMQNKHNLLDLAKKNRQNMTDAERKLWTVLRGNMTGFSFRRQHQIGRYIVDFVCLEKRLVIECDGSQHTEERDELRTKFLESEGFRVLRFWNNEILTNIEGVYEVIIIELGR